MKRSRLSKKSRILSVKRSDLEKHRLRWEKIAKENEWRNKMPKKFPVQLWMNDDGSVINSVSHKDMTRDVILIPNKFDNFKIINSKKKRK